MNGFAPKCTTEKFTLVPRGSTHPRTSVLPQNIYPYCGPFRKWRFPPIHP